MPSSRPPLRPGGGTKESLGAFSSTRRSEGEMREERGKRMKCANEHAARCNVLYFVWRRLLSSNGCGDGVDSFPLHPPPIGAWGEYVDGNSHHGRSISKHVLGGGGGDNDHVNVLPTEPRALKRALRSLYGEVAHALGAIEDVPGPDAGPRRNPVLFVDRVLSATVWRSVH